VQAYVGAKCVGFYFDVQHRLFNVRAEIWQGILMGSTVLWINAESTTVTRVVDSNRVLARALFLEAKRAASNRRDSQIAIHAND
jgi:hypothetical protein